MEELPMGPKNDKTLKERGRRNVLYIELKAPYPQLLKSLAERENRSAKAQAEVIVMRTLDGIAGDSAKPK